MYDRRSFTARIFLAKALFALVMIDILTPFEFYGKLFNEEHERGGRFWLTLVMVGLLVATLIWCTRRFGRYVLRQFRNF